MCLTRCIALALLLIALGGPPTRAQTVQGPIHVFLTPRASPASPDALTFVDPLSGAETRVSVDGRAYTVTDAAVLFLDQPTGRARLLTPDGALADHPFMQPPPDARRIDWAWAPGALAWTVTRGTPNALITETVIASGTGEGARVLLADGPRDGIRTFPIAFTRDGAALIMDFQPDAIGDITPVRQYASLFTVDLATGASTSLPGEPGCFCGAGFGAGWFLRLTLAEGGFGLRAFLLGSGGAAAEKPIAPLSGLSATQGGAFAIDAAGRRAAYALITLGLASGASEATRLVAVDLDTGVQAATAPIPGRLRPLLWQADAVLATDPAGATWAWEPDSGTPPRLVAQGILIGVLGYN